VVDVDAELVAGLADDALCICPTAEDHFAEGAHADPSIFQGDVEGVGSPLPVVVEDNEESEQEEVRVVRSKLDVSGHWKLVRTVGDMDAFMADMGANWLLRRAGRMLNYGIGRVTITMQQDGDKLKVGKVMADPTKRNAYMELTIDGEEWTQWSDEFGPCRVLTSLRDQVIHWDVRLVPSDSPSTMKMYLSEKGELIEEYSGPSGVTIQYFFEKRSEARRTASFLSMFG
jgi:hypothetical protein